MVDASGIIESLQERLQQIEEFYPTMFSNYVHQVEEFMHVGRVSSQGAGRGSSAVRSSEETDDGGDQNRHSGPGWANHGMKLCVGGVDMGLGKIKEMMHSITVPRSSNQAEPAFNDVESGADEHFSDRSGNKSPKPKYTSGGADEDTSSMQIPAVRPPGGVNDEGPC